MESIPNIEVPGVRPGPRSGVLAEPRLSRELETMRAMIKVYCRGHQHVADGICPDCDQLFAYAAQRLERCRFGARKPTCANCPTHCYKRDRLEQVKVVMRYSGPRILLKHPLLSLHHWLDGFRPVPARKP